METNIKGVMTQVAMSTNAALVKAANVNRRQLYLQNDGTVDILWGFTSTTCYFRLQPGATSPMITSFSAIYAKSASVTPNLTIWEDAVL